MSSELIYSVIENLYPLIKISSPLSFTIPPPPGNNNSILY